MTQTGTLHNAPRRQRGVVMFVALIVLVIMTLAGLAMLRQMGTGVSIAGNVAFKQNATNAGDLGTEAARAWIMAPGRVLSASAAPAGYLSSWGDSIDPTRFDWSSAPAITDAATGNTVKYLIHRLCELPNVEVNGIGQRCSTESAAGGSGGSSNKGGASPAFQVPSRAYFRITTQVSGPRNTVSYLQVVTN